MKRQPTTDDGRNILHARVLTGEAAQMAVTRPAEAWPLEESLRKLPIDRPAQVEARTPTYYDQPVVKAPPWKWYIPAYFYAGGAAGASSVLAMATQLGGESELQPLMRKARWVGTVGVGLGAVLLIADLGKPARFINMLRVFRPTSPMNVGTWILTGSGMANGAGVVLPDRWWITRAAGVLGGVFGLPLSTYAAVLLSNTAVPLWARSRRMLPLLFGASAMSSAASLFELCGAANHVEHRVIRSLAVTGKAGELLAMRAVERELGQSRVRQPLYQGKSRTWWKAAKVLGTAGLIASLWPKSARRTRVAAGLLGTAGAVAMRFAIVEAGKESARDPRATFEPQRARVQAKTQDGDRRPLAKAAAAEHRL